jgi:hypothetical protein
MKEKNMKNNECICIVGSKEKRYIEKIKVNSKIIKSIFHNSGNTRISFNLMMMTTDHRVLLLERTQSFHFLKVIKDLKSNIVNFGLWGSLYTSELEKIKTIFFNFIPSLTSKGALVDREEPNSIRIFPGGHSNRRETVISTLLRELREETSLDLTVEDLRFSQSCLFNVLIYDLMVKKRFDNLVFPIKINMSSQDIMTKFRETKHTRNPIFVDIKDCKSLYEAFILVQRFMTL